MNTLFGISNEPYTPDYRKFAGIISESDFSTEHPSNTTKTMRDAARFDSWCKSRLKAKEWNEKTQTSSDCDEGMQQ